MPETGPPQSKELESTVLDSTTLPLLAGSGPALGGCIVEPAELVSANYQAVYRYAFRLSGSRTGAEDITQETFLQALRYLSQLRSSEAQLGWLLAIARRTFLRSVTRCKDGQVQSLDATNADIENALGQPAHNPSNIQQVDDHDQVQNALCQLGAQARLIVVMYYFEELSYSEIANQLQIPIGTVMSRLNRSREALRRVLDAPAAHAQTSTKAQEGQAHV